MNKSFEYIRQHYNVPAEEGRRVKINDEPGTIINAWGAYVTVQMDGEPIPHNHHPVWGVEYLDEVRGQ
jgi:hypothetical protein